MEKEQITQLAFLSRLTVPSDELETLARDITSALAFIDIVRNVQLPEGNSADIEQVNIFRADVVEPLESAHDLVEVAPLHADHFVKVAKVIE